MDALRLSPHVCALNGLIDCSVSRPILSDQLSQDAAPRKPASGAMASAVNMLDDVYGGAGEQAVELYHWVHDAVQKGNELEEAAAQMIDRWQNERTKFIPGFGHRFHKPEDPRTPRLLGLIAVSYTHLRAHET